MSAGVKVSRIVDKKIETVFPIVVNLKSLIKLYSSLTKEQRIVYLPNVARLKEKDEL